jgi:hypothetical protein
MSLPFLKSKKVAGLIISHRQGDKIQESHSEDDESAGLHACSEDLIRAVHDKDVGRVSEALKAAFEILESTPHAEAGEQE